MIDGRAFSESVMIDGRAFSEPVMMRRAGSCLHEENQKPDSVCEVIIEQKKVGKK